MRLLCADLRRPLPIKGDGDAIVSTATIIETLKHVGDGWTGPRNFERSEETRRHLQNVGFAEIETWLQGEPTPLEPGGHPKLTWRASCSARTLTGCRKEREQGS